MDNIGISVNPCPKPITIGDFPFAVRGLVKQFKFFERFAADTEVTANQVDTYYFDIEKCEIYPLKDGCYKERAKSKTYSVTYIQNRKSFKKATILRKSRKSDIK